MLLMSLIIVAKFILKDIFVLAAEVILLLQVGMPGLEGFYNLLVFRMYDNV